MTFEILQLTICDVLSFLDICSRRSLKEIPRIFFFFSFNLFHYLVKRHITSCEARKLAFFRVGTMQMLEARHIELFLSEGFLNRSWEYELIGSHKIEKDVRAASAGIFDVDHFKDCQSAGKSSFCTLCSSNSPCSVHITKKDSQYAH